MTFLTEARPYCSDDGRRYIGYDIVCRMPGEAPLRAEDVTDDPRFARLLCAALNREQVEPVHFLDILSDILADSGLKNSLLSG